MPFLVLADTSVPRVIAEGTTESGDHYETTANESYAADEILEDDAVAPSVRDKVEEGDEHVSRLLRYISDSEAADLRGARSNGSSLQEVSVRDETPTDPNPHVPQSAEVGQYDEVVAANDQPVAAEEAASFEASAEEPTSQTPEVVETPESTEEPEDPDVSVEGVEDGAEDKKNKFKAKAGAKKKSTTKKKAK